MRECSWNKTQIEKKDWTFEAYLLAGEFLNFLSNRKGLDCFFAAWFLAQTQKINYDIGISIEVLGFSFEIIGILEICDNRIPYMTSHSN